jgi:hypothetical protein
MSSSIIPNSTNQDLNMSFTFDQKYEKKAIINSIVNHTYYQLEFIFNPDSDFEDIKSALLYKNLKIVERSPEILKIKKDKGHFLFKRVYKNTASTFEQSLTELN